MTPRRWQAERESGYRRARGLGQALVLLVMIGLLVWAVVSL